MEPSTLTQFYNDLKRANSTPVASTTYKLGTNPSSSPMTPGEIAWRNKAAKNCQSLKDDCRKHIILDIYAKVLPLDSDYIAGHQGQMCGDVDKMLACKGMTPTQYLTSCSESTGAPFVNYMMWATDKIGQNYMEKAEEKLKQAKSVDAVSMNEPPEPSVNDAEVQGQLVDIKNDPEYGNFIDTLKKKTINKIVKDISAIIADKKEEKEMTFDTSSTEDIPPEVDEGEPAQESAYNEAAQGGPNIEVKSELTGFKNLTNNTGTIGAAARKLVNLDKAIRKNLRQNLKRSMKAENSNRSWYDKIPSPDTIIVKLGDDEKVFKSSIMFSVNTKAAAKRFIKSLIKEYSKSSDKKWSKKCRIWLNIVYSTDVDFSTTKKKKLQEITNKAVNDALDQFIKDEVIKIMPQDVKVINTKDETTTVIYKDKNSSTDYAKDTTTRKFRYIYSVHLNMQYIFDSIDGEKLEKISESAEFDSYFDAPKHYDTNGNLVESSVSVPFDYIQQQLWNHGEDFTEDMQEQMIGMAIREATLHEFDLTFKQPRAEFTEYKNSVLHGNGYVVNEAAVEELTEEKKKPIAIVKNDPTLDMMTDILPFPDPKRKHKKKED